MQVRKMSKQELSLLDQQNQSRKMLGVPLLKAKVRKCIHCKTLFESVDKRSCGCKSRVVSSLAGVEIV
ncbi:MAG: hypothetical protein HRU09_11305 [Oligoflexales bacterium]|nr:hypothetical protein [Oligoflexales bacterium]